MLLVPVHWGTCPLMASLRLPSCPVTPGPGFMSLVPSAPCLPWGCTSRVAVSTDTLSWGQPPSISCWKGGLPLPALACGRLSVSGGCQFQPLRAFCGPWERHPWSWAVAGSAPASRKGNRLAREHRVLSTLTYITGLSYLVNVASVFFIFLVCLSGMFYRFSETSPTQRSLTSIIW